ncbi:MAG: hypothetical protein AAF485_25710, partial [Chloroflexota bacterium]
KIELELKSIESFNTFVQYFANDDRRKILLRNLNDQFEVEKDWEQILQNMVETTKGLINLISQGIREDRVLWVLGL